MGTSTDGILFYGIWFKEDEELPWQEEEDAELDDIDRDQWMKSRGFQLVVDDHCAGSYRMPYVAAPGTTTTAHRGLPEKLSVKKMAKLEARWESELRTFCEEHKISLKRIGWHLASYWGN